MSALHVLNKYGCWSLLVAYWTMLVISIDGKIKPIFRWYDLWMGLYIDRTNKLAYIFPVPMFGFVIRWGWQDAKAHTQFDPHGKLGIGAAPSVDFNHGGTLFYSDGTLWEVKSDE